MISLNEEAVEHLLVELVHLLEGLPLCQGEHQEETLTGPW